jgi:predicted transcriptional regulator
MKAMTRSEAETKRRKAVEFLHRIGNDQLAEEFDRMDAAEYAAHKGAELIENPKRRLNCMARVKTREQLQAELDEAEDYIEELEAKLDDIVGIAAEGEEETADEDEDDLGE